jgi:uncharacterized protein YbjT (DUF2867 family)
MLAWPPREHHRGVAALGMATPAATMLAAGAEAVYGDLKDPASLRHAMDGVRRVVSTANSAVRPPPDSVQTVEFAGNRALIDAAAEAGIEHLVFTSTLAPMPFTLG